MCPATIAAMTAGQMLFTSLAIGAATTAIQTGVQFSQIDAQQKQAGKQANAQAKAIAAQKEFNRDVAMTKAVENRDAAAYDALALTKEAARARGTLKAKNLTGGSATALSRDLAARVAHSRQLIGLNLESADRASAFEVEGAELSAGNQYASIRDPKVAGGGLQIASTLIDGVSGGAQSFSNYRREVQD
jgi:hypothetical protein